MIQKDYFRTRSDGVELYRTYSDKNLMIQKNGTEEIYREAIYVANSCFAYTETDVPIEEMTEELTVDDVLRMLGELGVDTDDNEE